MNELQLKFPKIAEQFDEELNDISVSKISRTDNSEYYFTCKEQGHTWRAKLYNRTLHNFYECPVCCGRIIQTGVNDFLTLGDKNLLVKVDYNKNEKENVILSKLHPRSKKDIWWRCDFGHSWMESIYNRARGTGCPKCSGKRMTDEKSLLSAPENIILEYSPNNIKKISEVSLKSRGMIEWTCSGENFNGNPLPHTWSASPYNRIVKNQKCPYCSNKKTLDGFNDIRITHPNFYSELLDKNSPIRFNESKSTKWKCHNCNFIYETSPRNKIIRGDKCQNCSNSKISGMEEELLEFVKNIYGGEIIHNDRKILSGKELDIYLPELKFAIEFNGEFWHGEEWTMKTKNMSSREWHSYKKVLAMDSGVRLFFVWERDWVAVRELVEAAVTTLINSGNSSVILEKLE